MNITRRLIIAFTGFTFCLIACTKSDPPVTTTPTPAVPRYTVTTIAGSVVGYKDGPALDARFLLPLGLTVDVQGNILVADADANRIRKITPSGIVSTFAGSSPIQGYLDGPASIAKFNRPTDVELDAQGNVLVCDAGNNLIRRISPIGVVSTFAGST